MIKILNLIKLNLIITVCYKINALKIAKKYLKIKNQKKLPIILIFLSNLIKEFKKKMIDECKYKEDSDKILDY